MVGLWPLALRRRGPFKVLEPIGSGRSDWLDVPVVTDLREPVLAAFLLYLAGHARNWDLVEHRDVLADSPTIAVLETLCRTGSIRLRHEPRTVAPYLTIAGSWEQFLCSKRAKFRSNIKYYRRLAGRDGVHIHRLVPGNAPDVVDDLAAVERSSWKARLGNLKVSTPIGREFYRRFCRYFAEKGSLEIWSAERAGFPVAFLVNIVLLGKCYHYNTCYREEVGHLSPGLLLHAEAIGDAFGRHLSEYDFLSGDEPYKDRWCANKRRIDHFAFFHRAPSSLMAYCALVWARWSIRRSPTLTRIRQRLLFLSRKLSRAQVEQ